MGLKHDLLVYTTLECESSEEMAASMHKAKQEGADLVELCIDSLTFSHISEVEHLLKQRTLPSIVSFRPNSPRNWCSEDWKKTCMQVLKLAVELDVEFVEIDPQVVCDEDMAELMSRRSNCKIIASSYVNGGNPTKERLCNLIINLQSTGADIIKLVIDVAYITDVAPVFHMLTHSQVPLIARAAGDRGLISQLLGPKYGAFFVCGSLGGKSTPGLPPLTSIKEVYKLEYLNPDTRVFGVISNPVGHSKGPLLHNPAFRHTGYNGIYVPLLVDNVKEFFRVFSCNDYAGFSVGIPHKEAAVRCCDEVDPLAKSIGAVNTIIRRPSDGKLVGYNTDCEACVTAIEDALRERQTTNGHASNVSPIAGKLFVLVGAGGAGRAIAFGAKSRGARVVIFNRKYERAKALAAAVSGEALPYERLNDFCPEKGMILANASAVGMQPKTDQTPISMVVFLAEFLTKVTHSLFAREGFKHSEKFYAILLFFQEALRSYELVFDAVYTPRSTRLLQEATEVGATVVSGVEMFVRQALGQFKLFTNGLAPVDFMRRIVYEQF